MRQLIAALLLLSWPAATHPALAEGEPAGDFDYYVLAMTWAPNWCATEGAGRPACDRPAGWTLHGLWPQFERGWPSFCRTGARDPSRRQTAAEADLFGSSGAAWYQWKKHGRCSGLDPADYFALARHAFEQVERPEVLRRLERPVRLPARVIEAAFLRDNPGWSADMLTITCKQGRIMEARLCLTRSLEPRMCGDDVRRDCAMQDALFAPVP